MVAGKRVGWPGCGERGRKRGAAGPERTREDGQGPMERPQERGREWPRSTPLKGRKTGSPGKPQGEEHDPRGQRQQGLLWRRAHSGAAEPEAEALPEKRKLEKDTRTVLTEGRWAEAGTRPATRGRFGGGDLGENLRRLWPVRNRPQRQGRCGWLPREQPGATGHTSSASRQEQARGGAPPQRDWEYLEADRGLS